MVSTTGMNTGVGIGGLFMSVDPSRCEQDAKTYATLARTQPQRDRLLFNVFNLADYVKPLSLGGIVGDGCNIPAQMPQF